ncbi:dihydrofolate reductase family protein [Leucobacter sp. USHLN153]|uniref:dihydrofolate reductase family protein n=1 Tax=Leucobacter sp. USHLN153 TaxID=3081268 RepID=UPI0030168FBA
MPRSRVHNLLISLDGFSAGHRVTLETPFGGAEALIPFFDGRVIDGVGGLPDAVHADHAFFSMWGQGIGAEIMGRRKFGPHTGEWLDDGWDGWWGDAPPFLTPTFILTHYPRDSIEFENGTSFHFIDASPAEALRRAEEAAEGKDVRIGGGPSTVNAFLRDDLIDFMHIVVVPIVLGSGVSVWQGLDGLEGRFDIESVTTGSGLTHQLWNRVPRD